MDILDEAIRLGQLAVDEVPKEDYANRSINLHNLGSGYRHRFSRTGKLEDLLESVRLMQEAIDATPENDPERSFRLHALTTLLQERYLRTADSKDIEEAIRIEREVVRNVLVDHRNRGRCLNNLGYFLRLLSSRNGKIQDLGETIKVIKKALDTVPEGHSNRAAYLDNIGICYDDLYNLTSNLRNLEDSIRLGREALQMSPDTHPYLAYRRTNLGSRFTSLYSETPVLKTIDEAIQLGQKALDDLSEDHYLYAQLLYNLGRHFRARFDQSEKEEELRGSTRLFAQALHNTNGEPLTRIKAGVSAALDMNLSSKWVESATILQESLDLLPRIAIPTGSRTDLQHTISKIAGTSALAASTFLKAGRSPLQALQILEQGRGIIASHVIDARSDVSLLRERYPDLHTRYDDTRKIVAMPFSSGLSNENDSFNTSGNKYTLQSLRRHEYLIKLEEVIREIQGKNGFQRFQLPPKEEELLCLGENGPLVSFNLSSVSSEAFIVTRKDIEALPLHDLKKSEIQQMVKSLANAVDERRRDGAFADDTDDESIGTENDGAKLQGGDPTSQMSSLWFNAVKPVLDKLGFLVPGKQLRDLPQIWWVGGGQISALPLHAAGIHHSKSIENTLSYAVSSFAPTLKFLRYSRTRARMSLSKKDSKVLIVSMPTTPGISGQLKVAEEVAAIESIAKLHSTVKSLEHPLKQDVLDEFISATICHFACHGRANALEPVKSALLLGKTALEELTVGDLDTMHNARAQIAYLSACSTAELKKVSLMDESIHLASTFSLAGFPHVIGTLWGAVDKAVVEVARDFYEELFSNEDTGNFSVAYALHRAVVRLRNENAEYILQWAPFIHIGS